MFKTKITIVNIMLTITFSLLSISNGYNTASGYLKNNLLALEKSMNKIEKENILFAKKSSEILNNQHKKNDYDYILKLHYYPSIDEFGFNRGVYKNNLLNCTLSGIGKPTASIRSDFELLVELNDMWGNNTKNTLIPLQYFYTSYNKKYFYTFNHYSLSDFSLPDDVFENPNYLKLHSDHKQKSELSNGYFYGEPYKDILTKKYVITIRSPVYKNNIIVGDIGTDFPLWILEDRLLLPNDLKSSFNFYIYSNETKRRYDLYKSQSFINFGGKTSLYDYLFKTRFNLDNKLIFVASFDFLYLIKSSSTFLCISFFSILIFNILIMQIRSHKKTTNKYKEESLTDPLTGLYNRRVLDFKISNAFDNCIASNSCMSIIVIDVNKFKLINDTYGHDIGDLALIHISNKMKAFTRTSDFNIRLGGDEFAIFLPHAKEENSQALANRLKHEVSHSKFSNLDIYTSISISCVKIRKNETLNEALKRADNLMYKSKKLQHK